MIDKKSIRKRWNAVGSKLDERGQRVFAAGEVRAAGWGGLEAVHEVTGLARSTTRSILNGTTLSARDHPKTGAVNMAAVLRTAPAVPW
jgi:hypothetical protein